MRISGPNDMLVALITNCVFFFENFVAPFAIVPVSYYWTGMTSKSSCETDLKGEGSLFPFRHPSMSSCSYSKFVAFFTRSAASSKPEQPSPTLSFYPVEIVALHAYVARSRPSVSFVSNFFFVVHQSPDWQSFLRISKVLHVVLWRKVVT